MNNQSSNPAAAAETIKFVAAANPDFEQFCTEYFSESEKRQNLPDDIVSDTITAMLSNPETAPIIEAAAQSNEQKFNIVDVGTLVAIMFLLRTHIKIERTAGEKQDKNWSFSFELLPLESDLLKEILGKIKIFMK